MDQAKCAVCKDWRCLGGGKCSEDTVGPYQRTLYVQGSEEGIPVRSLRYQLKGEDVCILHEYDAFARHRLRFREVEGDWVSFEAVAELDIGWAYFVGFTDYSSERVFAGRILVGTVSDS